VVLSISKIAILTFGMAILTSSAFLSQQAFGGGIETCENCFTELQSCLSTAVGNDEIDQCFLNFGACEERVGRQCVEVGGLPTPINESEVFGELAQQYSLWLIPAISAIGIATYLVKRKF